MSEIEIRVVHAFPALALDVDLRLGPGLTALLGPSGAGKTSVLNVVAGLLRADRACVRIGNDVLTDTDHRVFVPPHRRRIGYVFQESRLFPHLTVRQNLTFGRRFAPGQVELAVDEVVNRLELGALLDRVPPRLSGGEKRRVALGRALLANPRLLLLDEPLGSLDVERRQEILPYLDACMTGLRLPVIYVTHDHDEVERRAERVVTMDRGRARAV